MSKPLRVVGAIIQHEGKILACRRLPTKAAGGKWEFPGGKVEVGESPKAALKRELSEELGLDTVQVAELVRRETTPSSGKLIDLTCFRVSVETPPTSSQDHDLLRWCTPAELRDLDWAVADLPMMLAVANCDTDRGASTGGTRHGK
ncbi:(deoxy)nucleoside triphosphate pyrophosphohydrolase [Brevibacterium sp. SMBL_HHYL_HB1]|uniref:(deoxy)nucleoside triphosphate pyrophosphohydrolase n=1 Tax=Brevibacterium sp. SMBL_HHYL_HB1 TaxID=2777556 RepID=UPI001BA6CE2A|nr:(deoxy)nucleoside triphosphate pyrophosphohydrolase [Brevibacterium sp. SMBL_HHYL_HB1]QUL78729.1 (deoxy)nucleoside triphosphate pyrophosphohydrolase [Brevibacterium sp. SMBL_HHYL_HB1]